jgi:hypothetical protein
VLLTPDGRNQRTPKKMERAIDPTRKIAPAIELLPEKNLYVPPRITMMAEKMYM